MYEYIQHIHSLNTIGGGAQRHNQSYVLYLVIGIVLYHTQNEMF